MTLRGVSASIRFVEFSGCKGQSAVSVETPPGVGNDKFEVSFERVRFTKNGGRRQFIRGAAVRADACTKESCAKLTLSFASCSFRNNLATYGGAIYLEDGELKISESEFVSNEADLSGGAVYVQRNHSTTITVQRSRFNMNVARSDRRLHLSDEDELLVTSNRTLTYVGMGGAVFALDAERVTISESNFTGNSGCRGGGAVGAVHLSAPSALAVPLVLNVTSSFFKGNRGFCSHEPRDFSTYSVNHNRNAGGALMYETTTKAAVLWTVQRSTFISNAAIYGGGLSVVAETLSGTEHWIRSSSFSSNSAASYGGGAFLFNAITAATSSNFSDGRAIYGAGVAMAGGGVFSVVRDRDNPSSLSYIERNTALYNSGITAQGTVNLGPDPKLQKHMF